MNAVLQNPAIRELRTKWAQLGQMLAWHGRKEKDRFDVPSDNPYRDMDVEDLLIAKAELEAEIAAAVADERVKLAMEEEQAAAAQVFPQKDAELEADVKALSLEIRNLRKKLKPLVAELGRRRFKKHIAGLLHKHSTEELVAMGVPLPQVLAAKSTSSKEAVGSPKPQA